MKFSQVVKTVEFLCSRRTSLSITIVFSCFNILMRVLPVVHADMT